MSDIICDLSLKFYPYPSLRKKTAQFEDFDKAQFYFEQLLKIMYGNHGIGLAANQAGLMESIFVMDLSEERSSPLFIANPQILESSKEMQGIEEGCLSLPGLNAKVFRPRQVLLRYQDLSGSWKEEVFQDLASSCVQHEIDHLQGLLFPDRMKSSAESQKVWKKYKAPQKLEKI